MHNGRADLLFPTTDRNGAGQLSFVMGAAPRTALQIGEDATMTGDFDAVTGIDADIVAIFHNSIGKTFGVHHATIVRLAA
jgi:hypothetical protein